MAGTKKSSIQGKGRDIIRLISVILAFLGVADSIYLLVLKYTQAEFMCVGSHGCLTVNNSPYSLVYGIPIALIGLLGYLVMAIQMTLEGRLKFLEEQGPLLVFGESLIGVIFSAYLMWIELSVIHATCPFCVTSAVIILILFILAVYRLVKQSTH